ncbi:ATP-dependent sacrificial sulfur transferase LarE [uncultured Methanomethylovorans sp.]|uniref:ATP-dependent sacrificial sulfur transferase LarE n=1 Tax=uncultured Methanomethylovorans sp. TaxID=183759 RepID=UPI002AA94DDA|nr:ATP-dependent sacrificial sulfur transferase LarE [uncultured Methanomethylovorans sp.]
MFLDKMQQIKEALSLKSCVLVAFSGGVDSSVLAALAHEALGNKALAITINMHSLPEGELQIAEDIAREIGIRHKVMDFDEFTVPEFVENSPKRCYYCKRSILGLLLEVAKKEGSEVVIEGTNITEMQGNRPGMQAVAEMTKRVISPFLQFSVSREEIRQMAKHMGLSVAGKPSSPCLASRIPYGKKITPEGISRVKAAEKYLFTLGFIQFRVRDHGDVARIEVKSSDFPAVIERKEDIVNEFKRLGFHYVALDMEGFRSGSLDEASK